MTDEPTPGNPITIWRFHDAPTEYQTLSPRGGDEDWLALIPRHHLTYSDSWPNPDEYDIPSWMHAGTPFGVCDVSVHALPDAECVIAIGAHA